VPCKASGRLAKPVAAEERKDGSNKRIGFVVLGKSGKINIPKDDSNKK
jgi:hypothetical protein